jgi:hypothetical protein
MQWPIDHNNNICGARSIWWNLSCSSKPLALIQRPFAKRWAGKGLCSFSDIIINGSLISWQDLFAKFDIPCTPWRTYTTLRDACSALNFPRTCCISSTCSSALAWADSSPLHKIKAKILYSLLTHKLDIFHHLNNKCNLNLGQQTRSKHLLNLWHRPIEPKIQCFLGRLLLHRLPNKKPNGEPNICSICRCCESVQHVFFDCIFAKEVWGTFGLVLDRISPINNLWMTLWSLLLVLSKNGRNQETSLEIAKKKYHFNGCPKKNQNLLSQY